MNHLIGLLVAIVGFGTQAQAGFLIEPYANIIVTGKQSSNDLSGSVLGGRFGWDFLGFSLGLDAELAGGIKSESGGSSTTLTPGSMGLFAAYQFPILLRGYVTYSPLWKAKTSSLENTGNSTKIGVQYTGLPFVAIGVETVNFNITKQKSGGVESDVDGTGNYTSLVISLPFSL